MDAEKWNAFVNLIDDAFFWAEKSKKYYHTAFNEGNATDKYLALAYTATCTAKYSAAEAIYWTSPEIMRLNLSGLFSAFDDFVKEIQSDLEAGHPGTWVQAHFDRTKELYDDLKSIPPVNS